jgi:hypothetical protein
MYSLSSVVMSPDNKTKHTDRHSKARKDKTRGALLDSPSGASCVTRQIQQDKFTIRRMSHPSLEAYADVRYPSYGLEAREISTEGLLRD